MSRSISDKEWKLLIAASGGYCSFPTCDRHLVEPSAGDDDPTFLGEIAHIIADSRQGPRGRSTLSKEDRNKHYNLILLCREHHKIIDSQPHTYSVRVLQAMKRDHESRIQRVVDRPIGSISMQLTSEIVHSTLLPVSHVPEVVFRADTKYRDREESQVRQHIRYPSDRNELTPFILRDGCLYTFHDLRDPKNLFSSVISHNHAEMLRATDLWEDPEGHRRYVNLLNRALYKYASRIKIQYDPTHRRFFFPVREQGQVLSIKYRTLTGRRSSRKVAWEPQRRTTGQGKGYWFHLAAGLRFNQTANKQWCLSIRPERHLTLDGKIPVSSHQVGRHVTRLKARMYNDLYLGEISFWREYLAQGHPRIILNCGHQSVIIEAELLKVHIEWPGIEGDDRPYTNQIGREDLFSLSDLTRALEGERVSWDEFEDTDGDDVE